MRKRFHGLKRLKLRQSWSKYNLYNLSRATSPQTERRTHFQAKWTAKSVTRAYHGETVREKKWQRLFRRKINSVVPIDPTYLALTDGSIEAAGRGSGKDIIIEGKSGKPPKTPHMNMVYAPLERRLDTAIFRALFASSTRQARQFCVHGWVMVNGKKMQYPGYQLNPGDMFQVEPERVLYATGATKDAFERRATRRFRKTISSSKEDASETSAEDSLLEEKAQESTPSPSLDNPRRMLTHLLKQAKSAVLTPSADLTPSRKRDIRAFQHTVKRTLSRINAVTDDIEQQFQDLAQELNISAPAGADTEPDAHDSPSRPVDAKKLAISDAEKTLLKKAIANLRANPVDPSKPYATPWRPREYMSAFAFVPRYLEVHHRICSAVYLRHPVARPGSAEVPTPYGIETNTLAFNWYLRRR